jgi:hypothetical protein
VFLATRAQGLGVDCVFPSDSGQVLGCGVRVRGQPTTAVVDPSLSRTIAGPVGGSLAYLACVDAEWVHHATSLLRLTPCQAWLATPLFGFQRRDEGDCE